jgi:hypothetical protein
MKKTLYRLGVAAAAIVVTTAVVAGISYAYMGGHSEDLPEKFKKKHEEMMEILENNDYEAWKGIMEKQGISSDLINEDNFAKMIEAHSLMEEGRYDEAREIKKELGELGFGPKRGQHMRFKHKPFRSFEEREAIMNALDNSDYNTWREAVGEDSKAAQVINEDNFGRLVEAHNLMKEGKQKFDEARKIRKELGLEVGMGKFEHMR